MLGGGGGGLQCNVMIFSSPTEVSLILGGVMSGFLQNTFRFIILASKALISVSNASLTTWDSNFCSCSSFLIID